jgi:hypothetical protein
LTDAFLAGPPIRTTGAVGTTAVEAANPVAAGATAVTGVSVLPVIADTDAIDARFTRSTLNGSTDHTLTGSVANLRRAGVAAAGFADLVRVDIAPESASLRATAMHADWTGEFEDVGASLTHAFQARFASRAGIAVVTTSTTCQGIAGAVGIDPVTDRVVFALVGGFAANDPLGFDGVGALAGVLIADARFLTGSRWVTGDWDTGLATAVPVTGFIAVAVVVVGETGSDGGVGPCRLIARRVANLARVCGIAISLGKTGSGDQTPIGEQGMDTTVGWIAGVVGAGQIVIAGDRCPST